MRVSPVWYSGILFATTWMSQKTIFLQPEKPSLRTCYLFSPRAVMSMLHCVTISFLFSNEKFMYGSYGFGLCMGVERSLSEDGLKAAVRGNKKARMSCSKTLLQVSGPDFFMRSGRWCPGDVVTPEKDFLLLSRVGLVLLFDRPIIYTWTSILARRAYCWGHIRHHVFSGFPLVVGYIPIFLVPMSLYFGLQMSVWLGKIWVFCVCVV